MAKKKCKRNMSGLRNNRKQQQDHSRLPSPVPESSQSHKEVTQRHPDDTRLGRESDYESENADSRTYVDEFSKEWDDALASQEFLAEMIKLASKHGDDPRNEEWVPTKLRRRQQGKIAKFNNPAPAPKKRGPDVGSKSARTRRRYRKLLSNQVDLEHCGFTIKGSMVKSKSDGNRSESEDEGPVEVEANEHPDPHSRNLKLGKRKRPEVQVENLYDGNV